MNCVPGRLHGTALQIHMCSIMHSMKVDLEFSATLTKSELNTKLYSCLRNCFLVFISTESISIVTKQIVPLFSVL